MSSPNGRTRSKPRPSGWSRSSPTPSDAGQPPTRCCACGNRRRCRPGPTSSATASTTSSRAGGSRAEHLVGRDGGEWVRSIATHGAGRDGAARGLDHAGVGEAARQTLANVGTKRSVFNRANVFAEAVRQLHGHRFASAGARDRGGRRRHGTRPRRRGPTDPRRRHRDVARRADPRGRVVPVPAPRRRQLHDPRDPRRGGSPRRCRALHRRATRRRRPRRGRT
jgi:hypothetical protein